MPGAICCILLFGLVQVACAQSAVTVVNNGDPNNRVDIAFFGDGYTAGEMNKYTNDVQNLIDGIFTREPFAEYQDYFNVHRVDVVSKESGADHPELSPPLFRDTAFDAAYNCNDIQRSICVDTSEVLTVALNVLLPAQLDLLIVVVNDSKSGGVGGTIAVVSTYLGGVDTVLHEMGHSLGLLGDEYYSSLPPFCDTSSEPIFPNVTMQNQRELIKWNHWIDPATPIPSFTSFPGIPGLYQGGDYCEQGKYRPTYNSRMRSSDAPFEQVNTEQLVKRIYNLVSPLDTSNPFATDVIVPLGLTQLFSITTLQPLTHTLNASWYINGSPAGNGLEFVFDSRMLNLGTYEVEVMVEDDTETVRNDPAEVLSERRSWDVVVVEDQGQPIVTSLSPSSVLAGGQDFILTVSGMNFIEGSVVRWGGVDLVTSYLSPTQLTSSVPGINIQSGGTAQVTVFNPEPENLSSAGLPFSILDFSISKYPSSNSITAGQTARYTVTISPIGGFDRSVSLSCAGLPSAATCSINPSYIILDGRQAAYATIRVETTARSIVASTGFPDPLYPAPKTLAPLILILITLLLSVIRKPATPKDVLIHRAIKFTALVFVLVIVACGGGGDGGGNTPPKNGTPAGMSTLTVTAASGSLSHSTTIALSVK